MSLIAYIIITLLVSAGVSTRGEFNRSLELKNHERVEYCVEAKPAVGHVPGRLDPVLILHCA